MTLPLAWDLRGSSTGAGGSKQGPSKGPCPSKQGHVLPTAGTTCEKGEPRCLSCLPCKSLVPLQLLA